MLETEGQGRSYAAAAGEAVATNASQPWNIFAAFGRDAITYIADHLPGRHARQRRQEAARRDEEQGMPGTSGTSVLTCPYRVCPGKSSAWKCTAEFVPPTCGFPLLAACMVFCRCSMPVDDWALLLSYWNLVFCDTERCRILNDEDLVSACVAAGRGLVHKDSTQCRAWCAEQKRRKECRKLAAQENASADGDDQLSVPSVLSQQQAGDASAAAAVDDVLVSHRDRGDPVPDQDEERGGSVDESFDDVSLASGRLSPDKDKVCEYRSTFAPSRVFLSDPSLMSCHAVCMCLEKAKSIQCRETGLLDLADQVIFVPPVSAYCFNAPPPPPPVLEPTCN